ncbi:hypothetical protein PybrP1_003694 [[Pythium] brassicae (nom. inval.)]|nr:hypothetical protein PybrP1_003694 [[Pythium] brassicae (nom. inval.)]
MNSTDTSLPAHLAAAHAAIRAAAAQQQQQEMPLVHRVPYAQLRDPAATLRVNKWDAQILDTEILGLLKTPAKALFAMFEPGVADRVKPEVDALLGALLFGFSTGLRRPTPGMKLENVQFAHDSLTPRRVAALFVLSVGVPYVWKRLVRHISSSRWASSSSASASPESASELAGEDDGAGEARRTRVLKTMKWLETFVMACQFANLLAFLRKGTYRSLPERCLALKMESIEPSMTPRSINFEYMTRQLLWDGLMEFGNFALPFLTWSRSRATSSLRGSAAHSSSSSSGSRSQCSLCGSAPAQTPYITSCKHVYCYYCLQTAVTGDEEFAGSGCRS